MEITNVKNTINIKYKVFDALNKQLMQLIDAAGGQELDPNELKVLIII